MLDLYFLRLSVYKAGQGEYRLSKSFATEKHFQYTFYLILRLLGGSGCTLLTEKTQAVGRVDAVLEFKDYVYIFEFKLDGSTVRSSL
jgi:hypothetical protein